MNLEFSLDLGPLEKKLDEAPRSAKQAAAASLYQSAEEIMTESKSNYVPVDTGALRASGFVQPPIIDDRSISVALSYGGPAVDYALVVHENPDARHPHGQWKYLETPLKAHVGDVADRVIEAIKRAME